MLSGLNGQKFSFQGYLPREENELIKKIKSLENDSLINDCTQIFIEAPYRSDKLLNFLIKTLKDTAILSVAMNLTTISEKVITQKIKDWKKNPFLIGKNKSIFLFNAR
jgi:16S rRNA (cytidine1402-2'-O)-methyltransferase